MNTKNKIDGWLEVCIAMNFSSAEAMIDWAQATSCLTFIHKASQDTGLRRSTTILQATVSEPIY
jgi:hypothetical protein